jgi:hypothetical protein
LSCGIRKEGNIGVSPPLAIFRVRLGAVRSESATEVSKWENRKTAIGAAMKRGLRRRVRLTNGFNSEHL